MLARTLCFALQGVDGIPVTVETDVAGGMHSFAMVGLPDAAVRESRIAMTQAVRTVLGRALELICMKKTEKI